MGKKIIHITLGKVNPNRPNGVNRVVNSLITTQIEQGEDSCLWGITFIPTHNYEKRTFETKLFYDYKPNSNLIQI